jgi:hypothetical protein
VRAGSLLFGRTPGARPAVVGGLINGVAIAAPLLVGAAAGEPAAGATACLGAYVAAFTNKGGGRRSRTAGLVVTASINTVAYAVGAATTELFPLDVAVFAALVFIAAMGAAFGSTAVRCGTMPATDTSNARRPQRRTTSTPYWPMSRCPAPTVAPPLDRTRRTATDGMRTYVRGLHRQREVEMRAQPEGDTSLRAAIRENEPVIEELVRIAETIGSLCEVAHPGSTR